MKRKAVPAFSRSTLFQKPVSQLYHIMSARPVESLFMTLSQFWVPESGSTRPLWYAWFRNLVMV